MKSMRRFFVGRWLLILGIILVVGFILLRARVRNKETLSFIHPVRQDIEETIDVSGEVKASRTANLKFLAASKLVSLPVKEGDVLKKGQKIASVDARELQKNLQASLNDYLTARTTFDQTIFDNKDQAKTDTILRTLAKNQYSLNDAVYTVELKNIAISNAMLYSPIDGVLVKSPFTVTGVQVVATDAFEIVDPTSLQFEGEVDETDVGKVQVGQTAHIVLDAYPKDTLDAVIESIALKATTSTKASGGTVFIVKARIPNPDILKYRLGMNGSMRIVTKKAVQVLTIPLSVTIARDDKTYVKVKSIENNKVVVKEKEIQTGIENDNDVQVISGLSNADEVVDIK